MTDAVNQGAPEPNPEPLPVRWVRPLIDMKGVQRPVKVFALTAKALSTQSDI